MELQAVTGQLHILNGVTESTMAVPGVLAQPAPPKAARGRNRDFLFVHLTLTGSLDDTAVLIQDLLDSISHRFYQTAGSGVTAALRKAIIETNDLLLRLNMSGTSVPREGALTCAVLRGNELFVAQTGEAFALIGHNFGVEKLPAKEPDRITPLGRAAGLDIRYFHNRLQPGDTLLLVDPRLAHLPTQDVAAALVNVAVEEGLQEMAKIVGAGTARLLLVEFCDEADDYIPDVYRPTFEREGEPQLAAPSGQPRRNVQPQSATATAVTTRRPQPTLPVLDVEAVEVTARQATSQAAMSLSRLTAGLADLLALLWPPESSDEAGGTGQWAWPALVVIIIPILVTMIVTGVYFQRGRVVRFAEIKQEMNQNLGLATQDGDNVDAARTHYLAVLQLAAEADELRDGDAEIDRLRRQAQGQLDRIDGITRLAARPLYEYELTTRLTAVALAPDSNGGIFTLDRGNNRVYWHETDESYLILTQERPSTILFGGQAVVNHVVNRVVDIVWRARGVAVTRDGLAMLDQTGTVITFYPNVGDTRPVTLGFASDWERPVSITTFNERLYVLDVGAQEIWKYFADGDGFILNENDRTIRFNENPHLDQAVDFAIYGEDGSVLILYGDGRLRRYVGGRLLWDESDLSNDGLEWPLVSPTAVKITGRGLSGSSIFVADPGSGRIIQFSMGGRFLAQYKATGTKGQELFSGTTDFDVAENPLRIFVTVDNVLYVATSER